MRRTCCSSRTRWPSGVTYTREAGGYRIQSPHSVMLKLPTEVRELLVDGTAVTPIRENLFLIPAGDHEVLVAAAPARAFSAHELETRVLSFTGNIRSLDYGLRSVSMTYEAGTRALLSLNREPTLVQVDGEGTAFTPMKGNDCFTVYLPPGKHTVEIVAGDVFAYGVSFTSFWYTTAVAVFGTHRREPADRDVPQREGRPPPDRRRRGGRMTVLELDLSFLFVVAVILIWFMIGYQFVLTAFGYLNFIRSLRERRDADAAQIDHPSCTILIPAHNEEKVIDATLRAMRALVYPADRLTIMVINDGSKDGTKRDHRAACRARIGAWCCSTCRQVRGERGNRAP